MNTFKLTVYSRRWGHTDDYTIQKTSSGWNCTHMMVGGEGDKTGFPGLKQCFDQDSINYPAAITDFMETIWDQISNQEIDETQAQEYFDQLSHWISETEKATPSNIYN